MRALATIAVTVLVFFQLSAVLVADEMSDFKEDYQRLERQAKELKHKIDQAQERAEKLRSAMKKVGPRDPEYSKLRSEYFRASSASRQYSSQLQSCMKQIVSGLKRVLALNNKAAVEFILKEFYTSSKKHGIKFYGTVCKGLAAITDKEALDYMQEKLKSGSKSMKILLCEVFGLMGKKDYADALIETLSDSNMTVGVAAAKALAQLRPKKAVEPVISALEAAERKKREAAARGFLHALQKMTGQYSLLCGLDFRNWWEGRGKDSYDETQPPELPGIDKDALKDGPRSVVYGVVTSKRVIFICDVSGSMMARGKVPGVPGGGPETEPRPETGGDVVKPPVPRGAPAPPKLGEGGVQPGYVGSRIDILKIELAYVINKLLPPQARFNVITYSTNVGSWKKSLTKASKGNRESAIEFVKKMRASGGTNTYGALEQAFKDKYMDTIYFLSDGNPTAGQTTNHGEILAAVKQWNMERNVTIHTIGLLVGRYPREDKEKLKQFLRKLSADNGGECRIISDD